MGNELHRIFEQAAKENPNGVALQFSSETPLSYQDLNQWANRLAKHLQSKYFIASGDKVMMLIPRCADQVAILLALSKLGAIYVPLDGQCPAERARSINNDIRPQHVITTEVLQQSYGIEKGQIIQLSTIQGDDTLIKYDPSNLGDANNGVAYIVYTSGSTGAPKGVPIKHDGLAYWAKLIKEKFAIDASRNILHAISSGFDAHIWCLLMAWAGNASVHMVPDDTLKNTQLLENFIEEHSITDATLIPVTISNLGLDSLLPKTKLKAIYSTGEACTAATVKRCEKNGVDLWNCYGPTEATFGFSVKKCNSASVDVNGNVPLEDGDPDHGIKAHILDESGIPVSDGETGRLHIESPYLTPGYLQRPEEMAGRFINKTIGDKVVSLFVTDDKCSRHKQQADGSTILRYHGRNSPDASVKINGILVNLHEVESQLKVIDGIYNACVVVIEGGAAKKILVAYIQTDLNRELKTTEVKKQLTPKLVSAAIPAKMINVSHMPQTTGGKVDRKALVDRYSQSTGNFILPLEIALAKMAQDVLETAQKIKPEETIASLGTDSHKTVQLAARIKKQYQVDVPLMFFYESDATISILASKIYALKSKEKEHPLTLVAEGNAHQPPVIFIHDITGDATGTYQALIRQIREESASKGKQPNIYAIDAKGLQDVNNIVSDIQTIAKSYADAISPVINERGCTLVGWSTGGNIAWEIAKILESAINEEEQQEIKLILIDSICPIISQELTLGMFALRLVELVSHLSLLYNLDTRDLPLKTILEKQLPVRQIHMTFSALMLSNPSSAATNKILISYALSLGVLNLNPEALSGTPRVIRCHNTSTAMETMVPDQTDKSLMCATLGWSKTGTGDITVKNGLGGDHFELVSHPDTIKALAQDLTKKFLSSGESRPLKNNGASIAGITKVLAEQAQKHQEMQDQMNRKMEQFMTLLTQQHGHPQTAMRRQRSATSPGYGGADQRDVNTIVGISATPESTPLAKTWRQRTQSGRSSSAPPSLQQRGEYSDHLQTAASLSNAKSFNHDCS